MFCSVGSELRTTISRMTFCVQVDDKTLLASSGEGTVQSFDLRYRKPDIQSEVIGAHLAITIDHNVRPVGGHGGTLNS